MSRGANKEILGGFQTDSILAVESRLEGIRVEFNRAMATGRGKGNTDLEVRPPATPARQRSSLLSTFAYGGRFYSVPKNFVFPKAQLREAIRFWLKGQTVSLDGQERVQPFMNLKIAMLPHNLKATFRTHWLPIFKFLAEKLETQSTEAFEDDEVEIEEKYLRCAAHLKEHVSYCWNKKNIDPMKFTLGTWSNKISRSAIVKNGNATDLEKVSAASNRNTARPNQTRKKKKVEKPLYPSRQRRRIEKQQGQSNNNNGETNGEDAFGDTFGDVELVMTPQQAQRDRALKAQTDKEVEDGQRAAAAHRQAVGDGVGTDGSLLFVHHSTGLRRNYGDNSNIGRKRYAATLDSALAPRTAKKPPPTTNCAIEGCTFGTALKADHKCYNKCGRVFHNLCAQGKDLCDDDNELDMYCSMECKRSKRN